MKKVHLVLALFFLIGVGLLIGAGFTLKKSLELLNRGIETTGTVIQYRQSVDEDGRYSYYPIVSFVTSDGDTIIHSSSVGSSQRPHVIGGAVPVRYHANNPQNAIIDSFSGLWAGPLALGISGFLTMFPWPVYAVVLKKKKEKREWLKLYGERLNAKIQRVGLDTSTRFNEQHPFRIYAQWNDPHSGKVQIFKSESIWFNPGDYIKGENIEVLVDKNNPRKYWVDISFLPKIG
ncbi:hypothetical protein CHISP_1666 [Chitinispirillum alkaliphilum]|nr:hypothetical protein CHISP_1666 [Chitinispirillum alkaliphilum]